MKSVIFITGLPRATVARKLDRLEDLGLIERRTDGEDRRRRFIIPTERAMERGRLISDEFLEVVAPVVMCLKMDTMGVATNQKVG